ncbi:hypothetical protein GGR54DRAFT_609036 [Hypoxylon sp. NC1633]|nr:hypothetical protein GGR54DRAFT_609036 [Hypoxylon sp. NC1633]
MASSTALPLALLVIYITLSLPTIYITVKHGIKHAAIIGWLFLFAFFSLRIVASAIEINDSESSSAALIASVGLSPLLAAACGVLHESRAYLLPKSRRRFDTPYFVFFHFLITTAIALVAAGAANLDSSTLSADQVQSSYALVKSGIVMLLLGWVSLAILTIASYQQTLTHKSGKLDEHMGGRKLLLAVAISIPFLGIRVLERLVYFFTNNPELDPLSGSLGIRVGLEVIEEIIVSFCLVIAGIMTRNIRSTAVVNH